LTAFHCQLRINDNRGQEGSSPVSPYQKWRLIEAPDTFCPSPFPVPSIRPKKAKIISTSSILTLTLNVSPPSPVDVSSALNYSLHTCIQIFE